MEEQSSKKFHTSQDCRDGIRAVKDALDILNGSWKLPILIALYDNPKRFKELSRDVNGISDKMLSKELKDLEINLLVKRTVYSTFPPTVEYSITEHARSLENVMSSLNAWGKIHRKAILED